MRDALAGRARVSYEDLSDAELRDLHALCRRFMQVRGRGWGQGSAMGFQSFVVWGGWGWVFLNLFSLWSPSHALCPCRTRQMLRSCPWTP